MFYTNSADDIAYPDAFRRVFLHLDLWKVDIYLQQAMIQVHRHFFIKSPSSELNGKNVFNQGCIKRFIGIYSEKVIHEIHMWNFSQLFKQYLRGSFEVDSLRSVWSFLLSTLPKYEEKTEEFRWTLSSNLLPVSDATRTKLLMRNSILTVLLDLVTENTSFLGTFINAVSFRWVLLFCGPYVDPVTVYLALKILMLMKLDINVAESLNESGYEVLSRSMAFYHDIIPIYILLLNMLFGKEESHLPQDYQFNTPTLLALFKPSDKAGSHMSGGAILPIIRLINASSEFILNQKYSEKNISKYFSSVSWNEKGLSIIEVVENDPILACTKNCCAVLEFMSQMYQLNDFKELICEEDTIAHFLDILFSLIYIENESSSSSLGSGNLDQLCNNLKDAFFELIVTVLCDSLLGDWAPWRAIELVLKAIPSPVHEELFNFQSLLIFKVLEEIPNKLKRRKSYMSDSAVLNSIAKFFTVVIDRIYTDLYTGDFYQLFDLHISIITDLLNTDNGFAYSLVLRSDLSIQLFWKQLNRLVFFMLHKSINLEETVDQDIMGEAIINNAELIFSHKNSDIVFLKFSLYYFITVLSMNQLKYLPIEILPILLKEKRSQIVVISRQMNIPDKFNMVEILSAMILEDSQISSEEMDILINFSLKLKEDWEFAWNAEQKQRANNLRMVGAFKSERRSTLSNNKNNEQSLWLTYSQQADSLLSAAQNSLRSRQKITLQDINAFQVSRTADWQKLLEELNRERSLWGPDVELKSYWRLGK